MCGIVGLFLKDPALEGRLGTMLGLMLGTMCDRGPDSAGFSVYSADSSRGLKLTLRAPGACYDFAGLAAALGSGLGQALPLTIRDTHAILTVPADAEATVKALIEAKAPEIAIVGAGERMELYKEVGRPDAVALRFGLAAMHGSHGIGHTRMATESAVTTKGAHPFTTGRDQCLVHNGSLSNHHAVRRELERNGLAFETDNDSEVAAGYLTARMRDGLSLGGALEKALDDLDGFYTFVVGTKTGFAVLRDPIACKPAILAETDAYVAFGSEYRALVDLPGIETARVWEPEPATVYAWDREDAA
jgi:glutamate synthase domain-containing protein 1